MRKIIAALILSPFVFAGSAGNYYQVEPGSKIDSIKLLNIIQQRADSAAYSAVIKIDSICSKKVRFIAYSDLDKRPDGSVYQWDTWMTASGKDTLYDTTIIKKIQ